MAIVTTTEKTTDEIPFLDLSHRYETKIELTIIDREKLLRERMLEIEVDEHDDILLIIGSINPPRSPRNDEIGLAITARGLHALRNGEEQTWSVRDENVEVTVSYTNPDIQRPEQEHPDGLL